MTIRAFTMLAAALALAGCQTTDEAPSEVDRQAAILMAVPSNYRQAVPVALRSSLPTATTIERADISTPLLGSLSGGSEVPLVCVRLATANAGGPGAVQTIAVVFNDGLIVDSRWNDPVCASAPYSSFPELRSAYVASVAPQG